ncbi:MAG: YdeI/OmpD-associated family protein [Euryarchaeota archaeon]|nr:YdeI/OmpD-associated family protein [Euryarchaeota archaeon]
MVEITESRSFADRAKWRAWLEKNHSTKKELWLVFYKKGSGRQGIPYEDSVEEALCFGWIDGQIRRIDRDRCARRFTPRRRGGVWSESNIGRVERMKREGKMTKAGIEAFKGARKNPIHDILKKDTDLPSYIESALKANKEAWAYFCSLSRSHKRQYVWWVHSAKKEETRQRRLAKAVEMLARGKKPGINGFD